MSLRQLVLAVVVSIQLSDANSALAGVFGGLTNKLTGAKPKGPESKGPQAGELTEESIRGNIKLNNQLFEVACDCSDEWKQAMIRDATGGNVTNAACQTPTRYEIQRIDAEDRETTSPQALDESDVREFIGKPSMLSYVDVKSQPLVDMDGRHKGAALSGPGGDAGEFIRACQVWEELTGTTLDAQQVEKMFLGYLASIKPRTFNMHTTVTALEALQDELKVQGLDLLSPPQNKRAQLLGTSCKGGKKKCGLLKGSNIGFLELKLMMSGSGMYLIRQELVEQFIQVFYKKLWAKEAQLKLDIYKADEYHLEGAVAIVEVSDSCALRNRVPLLAQTEKHIGGKDVSLYVVLHNAVTARRRELAQFFIKTDDSADVKEEEFLQRLEMKGERAFKATTDVLGADIPVYLVRLL